MSNKDLRTARCRVMYEQHKKPSLSKDTKAIWGIFALKPLDNDEFKSMTKDDLELEAGYDGKSLITAKGMFSDAVAKGCVVDIEYSTKTPEGYDKAELVITKAVPVGFTNKQSTMNFLADLDEIASFVDVDDADEKIIFLSDLFDTIKHKKECMVSLNPEDLVKVGARELTSDESSLLHKAITDQYEEYHNLKKESDARSLYIQSIGFEQKEADMMSSYLEKRNVKLDNLRANPYILCNERLIGFKDFDNKWSANPRYNENDKNRLIASICAATIASGTWNGDTLHDEWSILKNAAEISGLGAFGKVALEKAFKEAAKEGYLYGYRSTHKGFKKVRYQDYKAYEMEMFIAKKLKLLSDNGSLNKEGIALTIDENADESQAAAIREIVNGDSGVAILTGGPGYGKTWTAKSIVDNMIAVAKADGRELEVVGMTPTGISAERLAESMDTTADTIHKTLGASLSAGDWLHNEDNRVKGDVFIIDESFMKDVELMYRTMLALPDHAKVMFLGDKDQLLPVGQGQPALDLMGSGLAKVCTLDTNHRTGAGSGISKIATGIMNNEMPHDEHDDFNTHVEEDAGAIKRRLYDTVLEYKLTSDDALKDSQVLLPQRVGNMGTNELNPLLRTAYRPELGRIPIAFGNDNVPDKHIETYAKPKCMPEIILEGDKVMQTQNCSNTDTRNGAMGIVDSIYANGNMVVNMFDGRKITFKANKAKLFELGYAGTGHRFQGATVSNVFLACCSENHSHTLERNNIYTQITRAAKECTLIGDKKGIEMAVTTVPDVRLSGLQFTCKLEAKGLGREMPHRDFYKDSMSSEQENEIGKIEAAKKAEADELMREAAAASDDEWDD